MEQNLEQFYALACIHGLYAYAGRLAEEGRLEERYEQVHAMVDQLATYYGLCGIEKQGHEERRQACLKPIEELRTYGAAHGREEFDDAHQAAMRNGLIRYREDMLAEAEPVYEPDIRLCDELVEEATRYLESQERRSGHNWSQTM
ncbi:hypothetical protein [Pseudoflavonifractor phocaeensis]|uniref:hypothetical protein n=1 Tax=Pseudoflavonifractor phocaeensis TaxID=1870988 RepID=UPI00210A0B1D|nr:hypothetical protein [Pseudoflavonifractor phocaeensis]MCQ4863559.1 hypothetical protein [Pseudoflavonifractor phocaeensis]